MDRFCTIQRKSNPLGRSLFSYITPQHHRHARMAGDAPHGSHPKPVCFYGLSYGGKTAVRAPTSCRNTVPFDLLGADLNQWVRL